MCNPVHFGVTYEINPWMSCQIGMVDNPKSVDQWNALLDALSKVSIVKIMDGVEDMPDLVFTANAGIVIGKNTVLSKFAKKERRPEEPAFRKWFEDNGYTVYQPTYSYEGEGDHLVDNKGRHWMGTGFRSTKSAAKEIKKFLNIDINTLHLCDHRWYHLDTCFCPLPNGELMWYPAAFDTESQQKVIESFPERLEVSLSDALKFSCNCVCIGNSLFLPKDTAISSVLRDLGYDVHEFDLSEFLKAGGAAKCLVLKCDT
jgi:N-dimethylarginine dimethylaminohydrolase